MSSITCESCGKIFSSMAAVCPHCGARQAALPRRKKNDHEDSAKPNPQGSFSGELIGASLLAGVGLGVHAENVGWYEEPNRGYLIAGVCLALLILLRVRSWWLSR